MTKRIKFPSLIVALCAMLIGSCAVATQSPNPGQQGRGQEELGYLVGQWSMNGGLESHPMYSSATVTGTMECEWFDGNYAVLCRVEQSSNQDGLPTKALRIFGYSKEAGAFTSYGLTNTHHISTDVSLGSFQNDTWTYAGEEKMNGQTVRFRETITKVSPTSFTLTQERAAGGGAWQKLASATFTKTP